MKRKGWLIGFGIVLLLLAGCKEEPEPTVWEGDLLVYYLNEAETELAEEWYVTEQDDNNKVAIEVLERMGQPTAKGYKPAIPETVHLPEVFIEASGLVTLLFDESYGTVTGISEVLMRAAIVKTLCQLDHIDSVEIYVSGQPLMNSQNMPVGIMKETDFIDNTGPDANYYQYLYAKVYYANKEGTALIASNLKIPFVGSKTDEEIVLRQLIEGPVANNMYEVLPEGVQVRNVSVKENVCTVDFSKEFLNPVPQVSEEVVIYSVVNTLAELPGIYKVQFLIEGKQEKIYQKMDLTIQYERNLSIIEEE